MEMKAWDMVNSESLSAKHDDWTQLLLSLIWSSIRLEKLIVNRVMVS